MRAVAGGLDHAPKIKWRKNQKALARANGTFRRASGWAGEKVARSGSRSSQPSREWVSVNRECGLFVCPTTTVSHRSKQAEQANVLLQDLTPFCLLTPFCCIFADYDRMLSGKARFRVVLTMGR